MSDPGPRRLPVPAAWQPAVLAAVADLARRLGDAAVAIAPTRVEEAAVQGSGGAAGGLVIWLMARGRTYRYRADLATGAVEAVA